LHVVPGWLEVFAEYIGWVICLVICKKSAHA
jgi:hypothetical protein